MLTPHFLYRLEYGLAFVGVLVTLVKYNKFASDTWHLVTVCCFAVVTIIQLIMLVSYFACNIRPIVARIKHYEIAEAAALRYELQVRVFRFKLSLDFFIMVPLCFYLYMTDVLSTAELGFHLCFIFLLTLIPFIIIFRSGK